MEFTNEHIKTMKKAIETYGDVAQKRMCVEECAELIQALCKESRIDGKASPDRYIEAVEHISEEVADVYIMLYQLQLIFGLPDVPLIIDEKLERLERRMAGETDAED